MRDGKAGSGDGGSFSGRGRSKRGSAGCCSWIVCGIAIFVNTVVVQIDVRWRCLEWKAKSEFVAARGNGEITCASHFANTEISLNLSLLTSDSKRQPETSTRRKNAQTRPTLLIISKDTARTGIQTLSHPAQKTHIRLRRRSALPAWYSVRSLSSSMLEPTKR